MQIKIGMAEIMLLCSVYMYSQSKMWFYILLPLSLAISVCVWVQGRKDVEDKRSDAMDQSREYAKILSESIVSSSMIVAGDIKDPKDFH